MRIIPNITRAISITIWKIERTDLSPDLFPELREQLTLLHPILESLRQNVKTICKGSTCADLFIDNTEVNLNEPSKAPIVKLMIEILEQSGCAVEEIYIDSSLAHPRLVMTVTAVS